METLRCLRGRLDRALPAPGRVAPLAHGMAPALAQRQRHFAWLARLLVVRYPVPSFMDTAWRASRKRPAREARCAQGHSLAAHVVGKWSDRCLKPRHASKTTAVNPVN